MRLGLEGAVEVDVKGGGVLGRGREFAEGFADEAHLFFDGHAAVFFLFLGGLAFSPIEFALAEVAFGFLDFGVALADGGVFLAADDGGDAVKGEEVGGLFVTGGGELEGGLFEDAEGGVWAAASAVSGVWARCFLKAVLA